MKRENLYEELYEEAKELIKKHHELEYEYELLDFQHSYINLNSPNIVNNNYNSRLGNIVNKITDKERKIMLLETLIKQKKDMINYKF